MTSYKIAIASRDSRLIYHFGQADRFLIYEISGNQCRYLETRDTVPVCSGEPQTIGHNNNISTAADLIADCRAVLVTRIGEGAAEILRAKGIKPREVSPFIDAALKQYSEG
ncbi:MAG: dinitrogenase iron-molybdenum cofactor biosynthesis protein [Candidatus Schekmanbacteria bacterium]|nr:dinitrogenase iron-molybdenum cofactor biosynthesis protein [Candidatus Schekmanbacteria bacterium]